MPSLVSPVGIDDEWSKWLVGEWQGTAKSDVAGHKDWVTGKCRATITLDLNGQFLVRRGQAEITGLSDEYLKYLRDVMHQSEAEIEKIRTSTFESFEICAIDPKTSRIEGWLFDSLGCTAKGTGRREGNKEIMEWQWSGQGQWASSIRITEKVSEDKLISSEKYTMPDGIIMEDTGEFVRKQ